MVRQLPVTPNNMMIMIAKAHRLNLHKFFDLFCGLLCGLGLALLLMLAGLSIAQEPSSVAQEPSNVAELGNVEEPVSNDALSLASNQPQTVIVAEGDNLSRLALRYDSTVEAIIAANQLTDTIIFPGQSLIIPSVAANVAANVDSPVTLPAQAVISVEGDLIRVRVQSGDSLSELALRYNSTIEDIMLANELSSSQLEIGQELIIPKESLRSSKHVELRSPQGRRAIIVQSGDSLASLADTYQVNTDDLITWNQLESDIIYVADILYIEAPLEGDDDISLSDIRFVEAASQTTSNEQIESQATENQAEDQAIEGQTENDVEITSTAASNDNADPASTAEDATSENTQGSNATQNAATTEVPTETASTETVATETVAAEIVATETVAAETVATQASSETNSDPDSLASDANSGVSSSASSGDSGLEIVEPLNAALPEARPVTLGESSETSAEVATEVATEVVTEVVTEALSVETPSASQANLTPVNPSPELALAARAQNQAIIIASKEEPEQLLFSELIRQSLVAQGFKVEIAPERLNSLETRAALLRGDIDIYTEYTGTALSNFFQGYGIGELPPDMLTSSESSQALTKSLDDFYHGLSWLCPAPANNRYVFVSSKAWATEANITSLEEVAAFINAGNALELYSSDDFMRLADGLEHFETHYQFKVTNLHLLSSADLPSLIETLVKTPASLGILTSTDDVDERLLILADTSSQAVHNPSPVVRKDLSLAQPEIAASLCPVFETLDNFALNQLKSRWQPYDSSVLREEDLSMVVKDYLSDLDLPTPMP